MKFYKKKNLKNFLLLTKKKTFDSDIFMRNSRGFYRIGCNNFKVNGFPNMTFGENKEIFGVNGFDFRKMSDEEIQKHFEKFEQ